MSKNFDETVRLQSEKRLKRIREIKETAESMSTARRLASSSAEERGGRRVCQSRLCQQKKKQSRLPRAPDRKEGESQDEREPNLGEKRGMRAEAWRGKGELQGEKGRFQGGEGG